MKSTAKQISFKKELVKKVHAVKAIKHITDDQYSMALLSMGVNSSTELSIDELLQLINLLNGVKVEPNDDIWRKRCMAAIGGWLRAVNQTDNADYIKAIACRATGYKTFNSIPTSRLRDLYNEFLRKEKTTHSIALLVGDEITKQIVSN